MNDKDTQLLEEALAKVYIKESDEQSKLPIDTKVMSWGFGATPVACIIVGYKTGGYYVQPIHNPSASCFQPYENIEPDIDGEDGNFSDELKRQINDENSAHITSKGGSAGTDFGL